MKIPINILLFLLALFLLRFPPLYYFGVQNTFFTTHVISVIIFIFLFLVSIYKAYKEKKQTLYFNTETVLILIFFITQSLSIIGAQNILVFLQRYSKIFIGLSLYLLIKAYINKYKNKAEFFDFIIKVLLFGSTIAIFLQLLLFVFPDIYFGVGQYFIYKNVLDITQAHFAFGKLFDDSYLEIIIPTLIFYISNKKEKNSNLFTNILYFTLVLIIGFISFISNFRYRFLAFLFSLFFSFSIFKSRVNTLKIAIGTFLILLTFQLGSSISTQIVGHDLIDRILLQSKIEDYGTVEWRLNMYQESSDMGRAHLFGVGLGNFYDNLQGNKFISPIAPERQKTSLGALTGGPHNIFFQVLAETGLAGLLSFISLIIFFIYKDFNLIKKKVMKEKPVLIASFWTLMIIAQFIPSINLTFYSLFFIFRAIIQED